MVEWTPESYNDPDDIQLLVAQNYLTSLVTTEQEQEQYESLQ
jgi:hypothetical protein